MKRFLVLLVIFLMVLLSISYADAVPTAKEVDKKIECCMKLLKSNQPQPAIQELFDAILLTVPYSRHHGEMKRCITNAKKMFKESFGHPDGYKYLWQAVRMLEPGFTLPRPAPGSAPSDLVSVFKGKLTDARKAIFKGNAEKATGLMLESLIITGPAPKGY